MLRILIFLIAVLTSVPAGAQQYNYTQYTVANGLPSNTVYDIKQDADGFIWIATDAGLVRFDGRKFVTYTMQDGLPTNDVIVLLPDSKGRLWITTMLNTACYHYKGKFYTSKNDSLLKQINYNSMIWYIMENDRGDIMFSCNETENQDIYILTKEDKIIKTKHPSTVLGNVSLSAGSKSNEFIIGYFDSSGKKVEKYVYDGKWRNSITVTWTNRFAYLYTHQTAGGKLKLTDSTPYPDHKQWSLLYAAPNEKVRFFQRPGLLKARSDCMIDKGRIASFICTSKGSYMLDTLTGRIIDLLLPGKIVNRALVDGEDNIWLSTQFEGAIMIPSRAVRSLSTNEPDTEIYSLQKQGNTIYAGSSHSRLFQIRDNQISNSSFSAYMPFANNQQVDNRLLWIQPLDKEMVLGFDDFIIRYDPVSKKKVFSKIDVTKSMFKLGGDSLILATGRGVLLVNNKTLAIKDSIWKFRTYCVLKDGDHYYAGTSSGPVRISPGKQAFHYATAIPELQTLVNNIVKDPDGGIWMSTLGNGVFKIRGESVEKWINANNGLNSNNCKVMVLDEKFLWIGTEKGLNRINRQTLSAPILNYTTEDGLASNDIHALLSDSGTIYVGARGNITWFDTSRIRSQSVCHLRLLNISLGNRSVTADSLRAIPYNDNNLRLDFTGISFKSSNNILYMYRLKGFSDNWDSTRNTNLEFLALPPGEYQLEIFARNKFGLNSDTLNIPFVIKPPFWGTWWFRILIIGILTGLVWWILIRRIRREQAKTATQNRINELEQQALRSQMNPHFIFNCLNSIQNFLLQNNFEKTNEYLSAFAHLIRQTLDNSSRSSISIEGEIKYLSSYLELESMRFAHSFSYSIHLDPEIDADDTHIPTMVLQPYVENSIRHGLRYKQEGGKAVKVSFLKRGNALVCIVEDNGVGRKKASELKSFLHVEYQSKGMTLTAERIAALNRRQQIPITVDVMDLEDAGNATGTQVIVRFPNVFL